MYSPNIPHCSGLNCQIKEQCWRYEFSNMARQRGTSSYAVFTQPAYEEDFGLCKNLITKNN